MSTGTTISEAARDYLRVHLVDGIGPILTARLIEHFGGAKAVLTAGTAPLAGVDGIGRELAARIARSDDAAAEQEIRLATERGVGIICPADAEYPAPLKNIPDSPPCLYVRGSLQPEDVLSLGIVGSRHCSVYGAEQAERFAALAAQAGLTIVSGMALGIDTAAHRGALLAKGRTLAVLGCGMCHLYPARSGELADQIAANGAVLSDFSMDTPPVDHNFPRRNRIVAGLSLGVLVVEASKQSGALITARLASEYNREVFAIPGRVDTPYADGCHDLIRKGAAKLVMNLADILEELGDAGQMLMTRTTAESPPADASAAATAIAGAARAGASEFERKLFEAMPVEPATIETLTELSGLSPARVAATLTSLLLKGVVKRHAGDVYTRVVQ